MRNFVSIGEAAKILNVSISTLRRWDSSKKLVAHKSPGGSRRYRLEDLITLKEGFAPQGLTVAYIRKTKEKTEDELIQQKRIITQYCDSRNWKFRIIIDTCSTESISIRGTRFLMENIFNGKIKRLIFTNKNVVLHTSPRLLLTVCKIRKEEVIILNSYPFLPCSSNHIPEVITMTLDLLSNMPEVQKHKKSILTHCIRDLIEG